MNSDESISQLVSRLMEAAKVRISDSQEVDRLLKSLEEKTVTFEEYFAEAKKDGIIDDQEYAKLMELRSKLIEDAITLTQQDEEITDEEFDLLDALSKISLAKAKDEK